MDFRQRHRRLQRPLDPTPIRKFPRGTTLAEVVVAATLLSLLLLFGLRPLLSGVHATKAIQDRERSELLAHQLMMQALLTPASTLQSRSGTDDQAGAWNLTVTPGTEPDQPISVRVEVDNPRLPRPIELTGDVHCWEPTHE